MIPKKQNTKERKSKAGNKKKNIIVPLISVLMLISIICTIASGINLNNNANKQIAEIEPNKEQISAETITLNAGEEYIIPEDGKYKIELHGGSSSRHSGSKVMREVVLHSGDRLEAINISAFEGKLASYVPRYINTKLMKAGDSLELYINSSKRGFASGGRGVTQVYKQWDYYEDRSRSRNSCHFYGSSLEWRFPRFNGCGMWWKQYAS